MEEWRRKLHEERGRHQQEYRSQYSGVSSPLCTILALDRCGLRVAHERSYAVDEIEAGPAEVFCE